MKCHSCQRKLTLPQQVNGACKCGNVYCSKHLPVSAGNWSNAGNSHVCSWDHLREQKIRLEKNNPAGKRNSGLEMI